MGHGFHRLPDLIANGILSLTGNKYVILILMNIILLIVGTFMDPTPAVLIFTPIFLPICKTFGMHAVQFGIMVSMNLCIAPSPRRWVPFCSPAAR